MYFFKDLLSTLLTNKYFVVAIGSYLPSFKKNIRSTLSFVLQKISLLLVIAVCIRRVKFCRTLYTITVNIKVYLKQTWVVFSRALPALLNTMLAYSWILCDFDQMWIGLEASARSESLQVQLQAHLINIIRICF